MSQLHPQDQDLYIDYSFQSYDNFVARLRPSSKLLDITYNYNLVVLIFTEFLTYLDVANFDTALIVDKEHHKDFLDHIEKETTIFGKYGLDYVHIYVLKQKYYMGDDDSFLRTIPRDHSKWNIFLSTNFMAWLVIRKIHITGTFIIPNQLYAEKDMNNFQNLMIRSGKYITNLYFSNFVDLQICASILTIIADSCPNLKHLDCWEYGPWCSNPRAKEFANRPYRNLNIEIDKFISLIKDGKFCKLLFLNITGCWRITKDKIYDIVNNCLSLQTLYFGTCENVTNRLIIDIVNTCSSLNALSIYQRQPIISASMTVMT